MHPIAFPNNFLSRFAAAALAIFTPVNIFLSTIGQFMGNDLLMLLVPLQALSMVLGPVFSVALFFFWRYRERSKPGAGVTFYAICVAMVRFWLAICLAEYGLSKIMHWQFDLGTHFRDIPMRQLDPVELTWYYFGYSYTYACILGCTQVLGSLLLLFRRTFLLGVIILLPVLINIVLIDIFFHITPLALLNAIVYTLGLFFLLLLHWQPLKTLFLQSALLLPHRIPRWLKYSCTLLGVAMLAWEFGFKGPGKDNELSGKWNVDSMLIGGYAPDGDAWLHNQLALKTVYFTNYGTVIWLNPNPFILEQGRALQGNCRFAGDTIYTNLRYGAEDWGPATIIQHPHAPKQMCWTIYTHGLVKAQDTLQVWLSRAVEQ